MKLPANITYLIKKILRKIKRREKTSLEITVYNKAAPIQHDPNHFQIDM